MDELCRDKVFAYNWIGENLYFVVFREEGNFLRTVRTDGVPGETIQLPEVYGNAYDVIARLPSFRSPPTDKNSPSPKNRKHGVLPLLR